jgi:hypothetical protein
MGDGILRGNCRYDSAEDAGIPPFEQLELRGER